MVLWNSFHFTFFFFFLGGGGGFKNAKMNVLEKIRVFGQCYTLSGLANLKGHQTF